MVISDCNNLGPAAKVLLHVAHKNWLNPAAIPLVFLQLGEVSLAIEKYIFMHTSTCIVLSTRMNL